MSIMAGSPYQARATFDESQSSFMDVRGRQLPEVRSYNPPKGPDGTKFSVYIQSPYDFSSDQGIAISLMFGSRRCTAIYTKSGPMDRMYQYTITADVPPFATTDWSSPRVPVSLHLDNDNGQNIRTVEVGEFTYVDGGLQKDFESSPELSRKRKTSSEPTDLMRSPAKRTSSQQLRPKGSDDYPTYGYTPEAIPYSPYLQPNVPNSYGYSPQIARSPSQSGYHTQSSSRQTSYGGYPGSSSMPTPTIKAPTPPNPSPGWSSAYGMNLQSRSPGLAPTVGTARNTVVGTSSPANGNPQLIRTSTLQIANPGAATGANGQHPNTNFNPYGLYPHKAVLKIDGDLDSMALMWTKEEWEAKRRIVQFERSQSGSAITTTFKAIGQDQRPPNSICISCIWWEEMKECYVTSVDTIFLLESLVAVRFTVEEKNRIRRNLEGFKPQTVSKAKPEREEFFKIIMGFPNPKPRNIEKDVKVFPWKILALALKKIIGKYVSLTNKFCMEKKKKKKIKLTL
jgi:hypothetical protein